MKRLLFVAVLLATRLLGANADVDPNFYIYICFGQSNMEGNAQPESIDKTASTIDNRFRLLATCNFSSPSRKMGNWYKATPPLVSPNGGLGPTDYFGRMMCENLPQEVRIGVIPVAMGGSPIEMFDKDKYQQKMKDNPNEWWAQLARNHYGGNPYGRIIEMAKKAQEVGVIKGILLHQGCSNNGDPNWPNMVKKIYNDMLTDLGLGADSVPLFVGETLRQDQGGSCYAHNTQVARMPEVVKGSRVISSEGCPGNGSDPWHFNALGYRIMGSRYAAEGLYTLGKQYPYFSFHNYDLVANKNCTFAEKTRTLTVKSTGTGVATWTYPNFADWSGYKYLIVKLKEPQAIGAEIFLYGQKKNVSYRDTINDRTFVVIDLHNLKYNKTVMDPSKVYKMAFRAPKAGKMVIDDVYLTNDDSEVAAIRSVDTKDTPFRAPLYSLDGRLADPEALKPGIYIRDGKKIVVR